jgi:hypothetical protein
VDWQLRELGGAVSQSTPKDDSFWVLDLPPFLADLMRWAMDNRRDTCSCQLEDGKPTCKGEASRLRHVQRTPRTHRSGLPSSTDPCG